MIEFSCPTCKRHFTIPDEFAGKRGKCPKCKNSIPIPKAEKTELVNKQEDTSLKSSSESKKTINIRQEEEPCRATEHSPKQQSPEIVLCKDCEKEMHRGEQAFILKDRTLCEECWTTSAKEILIVATLHKLLNCLFLVQLVVMVLLTELLPGTPFLALGLLLGFLYFVFITVPVWLRAIDVGAVGRIVYCTGILLTIIPFLGGFLFLTVEVKLLRRIGVGIVWVMFYVFLTLTLFGFILVDNRARAYLTEAGLRGKLLGVDLSNARPRTITYEIGE